MSGNAFAHGLVDQGNTGPFVSSLNVVPNFQPAGQEFVPQQNNLVGVDIFLHDFAAGFSGTFTVTIWENQIGNGAPLGSSTTVVSSDGLNPISNPQIEHFDFATPITLQIGTKYVIQIENTGVVPGLQLVRSPDLYSQGDSIFDGVSSASDWGFRTYYQDQTVGGEFISIETTSLLIAGAQTSLVWILPAMLAAGATIIAVRRKF